MFCKNNNIDLVRKHQMEPKNVSWATKAKSSNAELVRKHTAAKSVSKNAELVRKHTASKMKSSARFTFGISDADLARVHIQSAKPKKTVSWASTLTTVKIVPKIEYTETMQEMVDEVLRRNVWADIAEFEELHNINLMDYMQLPNFF